MLLFTAPAAVIRAHRKQEKWVNKWGQNAENLYIILHLRWSHWQTMTICLGTENGQSISTSLSSHPAMRRFSAKCASLPREGGAKWDLDPFFLFLSPPQFEIWNLVHFSRVCPPGFPVPPAPALLCYTHLHLAFSDLNQFWHLGRKLMA